MGLVDRVCPMERDICDEHLKGDAVSDANKILKMIEDVSPDDTAKLDEIDARVWCWVKGYEYLGCNDDIFSCSDKGEKNFFWPIKYTRSRDALKEIRPVEWEVRIFCEIPESRKEWYAILGLNLRSPLMLTEELAELHAIIRAIKYERSQP